MNPIKALDENIIKIRPYDEFAYGEIRELNSEVVYFKPKNIKEVNSLRKVLSEIENARLVNVAGVAILGHGELGSVRDILGSYQIHGACRLRRFNAAPIADRRWGPWCTFWRQHQ